MDILALVKSAFNKTRYFDMPFISDKSKRPTSWTSIEYKEYKGVENMKLANFSGDENLKELLLKRKSSRSFSGKVLTFSELSNVLYSITEKRHVDIELEGDSRTYLVRGHDGLHPPCSPTSAGNDPGRTGCRTRMDAASGPQDGAGKDCQPAVDHRPA